MEQEIYTVLKKSLIDLGIEKGDIVLLKGDLSEIGMVSTNPKSSLALVFQVLWDVLGGESEGTIITSSFTDTFFKWKMTNFVFDEKAPSRSGGAFAKYFLSHPNAVRSKHPSNSFVAIGKRAQDLVKDHNENSRQYDPVGKVIELNGKALTLGAVVQPPDFMTGHYAQQQAGYTTTSILSFLTAVRYKKGNEIKVFKVREIGGCSRGHYKVYARYVTSKKLKTAFFGSAYSISMPAQDAFEISYEMQKANPRSFLCDDPNCFSCRGSWFWNMRDWPIYYLRNGFRHVKKIINAR